MTGSNLTTISASATQLAPAHHSEVAAASRPVLAANSITLYRSMLAKFEMWATGHGYATGVPANQDVVAAWLLDLAKAGTSVTSINVALAAVRWTHEQAGHPFARSPGLANVMKRIRRDHATTPDQAAPLRGRMLADMLASVDESPLAIRDAAMLALAYVFALRRSELVAIDYAVAGDGGAVLTLSPDALTLTIRRSKTSQEAPQSIAVPRDANPRAVGAVERWIRVAAIAPGDPVMMRITPMDTVQRTRLTADAACRAIQRAVERYLTSTGMDANAARIEAKRYGGHSCRVGFITTAVENGATHENVGRVSRHAKGSRMIARYSESADQLRLAPHRIAGVGV